MVRYKGHTIDTHLSGWYTAQIYLPNAGQHITITAATLRQAQRQIDRAMREDKHG